MILTLTACQSEPPVIEFQGLSESEWGQMLLSTDDEVREEAFARLVAGGADAVPVLMARLRTEETWSHRLARSALREIGADALPALAEAILHEENRATRWSLVVAAQMGSDAAPIAPHIVERMIQAQRTGNDEIVSEAYRALYEIGPDALPALVPMLDLDSKMRERVFTLAEYWEGHSLPFLEDLKGHSNLEIREAALKSSAYIQSYNGTFDDNLRRWQRTRERHRPGTVRDLLRSRPDSLDYRLAMETGIIEMEIDQALVYLGRMLESENGIERRRAARALTGFGARPTEMLPMLIAALERGDAHLNWEVMRTLSEIGPEAEQAIPFLVDALHNSEDHAGRRYAAQCLISIGSPAPGAEEFLVKMIRTKSDDAFEFHEVREARRAAIYALARINPGASVPVLIEVLDDPSWTVQRDAIDALVLVGPLAVSALTEALASESHRLRRNATCALMRIGRDSITGWVALQRIEPNGDPVVAWAHDRSLAVLRI